MKPEAQRIAIAEALGRHPCDKWEPTGSPFWGFWKKCDCPNCYPSQLGPPKYDEQLEAMHEAEKGLPATKYPGTYESALIEVSGGYAYTATAAQRAEAWLRCMNLWTDEKP